jgi:thiopeptide-type bacteriocin biosynthesis protein
LVWKIQIDTYFPELERYGNANIENSETLFFFDSVASMEIISMLEGDEGDNLRWVFAIKGVNDMLDSFKFTLEEKTEIMRRASEGFRKEFRADNIEVKKQLTEKFRGLRKQLEIGFSKDNSELEEFRPVWEIFAKRKVKIDECVQKIEELELDNKLEVGKTDLALSYVHMFLNRFLRSKQRFQEMVLYDLLFQHFNSHLARKKKKNLNSI